MAITDELRAWAHGPDEGDDWLDRIDEFCDRIDAAHQKSMDEWKAEHDQMWLKGYAECHAELLEGNETIASDLEECGLIRLPKDADGEYIHVGDVMEGVDKHDSLKKVMGKVITVIFEADGLVDVAVQAWNGDGKSWRRVYLDPDASLYRHYRAPTVEDVLREFAEGLGVPVADSYIAASAAKLRLAKEGE